MTWTRDKTARRIEILRAALQEQERLKAQVKDHLETLEAACKKMWEQLEVLEMAREIKRRGYDR